LLLVVGKRIIKLEKRLDAMVFGDSEERIIEFINEYMNSCGKQVNGTISAPNLLTHQEISTLTGTSRQTVTRIYNQLRNDGFIDYDTHSIFLLRDLKNVEISNSR
jgi:CRP/FNR family transcriptional regulator, cyclic AMP receptor protein